MGSKATKAVRNVWARLVVQDLEKRGIDAAGGLRNAGLGAFALADEEGWIPFVKHSALLDYAADQTGDSCYGARLAAKIDIRDGDALGYIGLASGTLEDVLRNLERYLRVVTEAIQVRLTVDGETATLEGVGDRELLLHCGQAVEFATSLLLSLYRTSTGRHIKPIEIRFSHRREDGAGELKRILDCPVSFSCGRVRADTGSIGSGNPDPVIGPKASCVAEEACRDAAIPARHEQARSAAAAGATDYRAAADRAGANQGFGGRNGYERAHLPPAAGDGGRHFRRSRRAAPPGAGYAIRRRPKRQTQGCRISLWAMRIRVPSARLSDDGLAEPRARPGCNCTEMK